MSTNWKYLPILKWKAGERGALSYLFPDQWPGIVPCVEVQPPEKPKGHKPQPTVQELRAAFATQVVASIPAGGAVAVDTTYVAESYPNQLELLARFCRSVREANHLERVIPVIPSALVGALATAPEPILISLRNNNEVMLRVRTDLIDESQISGLVAAVKQANFKSKQIHLLIDQFSIVGADPAICAAEVQPYLKAAFADNCASVTVAGGSFPVDLMGIKQGQKDLPRVEWKVWANLAKLAEFDALRYSDYTVTNPSRLAEIDPRQVNPSISIRYAAHGKDFWRVYKGGGFKKGKPGTLKALCELLVTDDIYSGRAFSSGDKAYDDKANMTGAKADTNGIPWTWRRDATNHHIALIAAEL